MREENSTIGYAVDRAQAIKDYYKGTKASLVFYVSQDYAECKMRLPFDGDRMYRKIGNLMKEYIKKGLNLSFPTMYSINCHSGGQSRLIEIEHNGILTAGEQQELNVLANNFSSHIEREIKKEYTVQ